MATTAIYTQKDFEAIINRGINYTIPSDILNNIQKLEERVKQYVAGSQQQQQSYHRPASKPPPPPPALTSNTANTWKTPAITKTSTVVLPIHQIKSNINKLSRSNFDKLKDDILSILKNNPQHIDEWAQEIVDLLSRNTNQPMSALYADLFMELYESFPETFETHIMTLIQKYREMTTLQIPTKIPNEDDPTFYEYNKFITEIRGKIMFLTHWFQFSKKEDQTIEMLSFLFKLIEEALAKTDEQQKSRVDEWTEQIALVIKITTGTILTSEMKTKIQQLGQINIKTSPNMTSRSKFKFQDILC